MSYCNVFYRFNLPLQFVPKIITIFIRTTKYTKRGIMALMVRLLTDTVYIQKYSACEFLYFLVKWKWAIVVVFSIIFIPGYCYS